MGSFLHACEGEIVCESNNAKIPYFNAPIYLENKVSRPHIGDAEEWLMQDYRHQLAKSMRF
jgi:Gar1/Naf1 RNA binding region